MSEKIDDVLARLSELLADILDQDGLALHEAATAEDVEGWDSLANVRFMLGVETAFGVRFSAAEMASFKSVGDLARCIAGKIA